MASEKSGSKITEAARLAALAAKAMKRAEPDTFGLPELFIAKAGDQSFTWELRRFGGLLLRGGDDAFPSQALARADGEAALTALCSPLGLPTFKRALLR